MVKRRQHIGTFLHNEMGISLRGISPMCGRSSIHLQKIFFLRSIEWVGGEFDPDAFDLDEVNTALQSLKAISGKEFAFSEG
jgi:hypothetical protein